MNITEIADWLQDTHGRPASPQRVAEELDRCTTTNGSMVQWGRLYRGMEIRFYNDRRRQFSPGQMEGLRNAADYGAGGALNATSFPNLNRARIAFQLMARVIEPGRVNQGPHQLCGPAAVVVSLAREHPKKYAETCADLADRGEARIGNWLIQPSPAIRNHASNQEADWVMCASVRADSRAIADTMYGTSGGDQVFDWLRGCGFEKVVLLMNFPLKTLRSEPARLLPPSITADDKTKMVRVMADLANNGWTVIMFAFGAMPTALDRVVQANQVPLSLAGVPGMAAGAEATRTRLMQQSAAELRTENPSLLSMAWRLLTGTAAAHTMHVTFVDAVRIHAGEIRLNCANFGQSQRWITLPLDAFVNKFAGFAAATDIS